MIRSSFLSQAGAAVRACVAVLAFAAAGATAARAADIPSDLNIDLSSVVVSKDELVCLALNDYWEARSETMAGRIAVAQVVMNRAMDFRFPSNICEVVKQNFFQGSLNKCQFSWFCDDRADTPYEADAWRTSLKIAAAMLQKDSSIPDPTGGALWYHADHVRPSWTGNYETTTIIGSHVFYRDADSPHRQQARKPFIYRLNAFAEYVSKHQGRRTTAVASAATTSPVPMQRGAVPVQPIAR
ncbi:MAG: cell wall hydrolase [Rhodospirillaceae bacterium]